MLRDSLEIREHVQLYAPLVPAGWIARGCKPDDIFYDCEIHGAEEP